jgi:hypothetical protein
VGGFAGMNDYGPSRGELKFRIIVSILGLCFLAFVVFYRGMPSGPAMVEVVGLGGLLFGGTIFFAVRRLIKLGRK